MIFIIKLWRNIYEKALLKQRCFYSFLAAISAQAVHADSYIRCQQSFFFCHLLVPMNESPNFATSQPWKEQF